MRCKKRLPFRDGLEALGGVGERDLPLLHRLRADLPAPPGDRQVHLRQPAGVGVDQVVLF